MRLHQHIYVYTYVNGAAVVAGTFSNTNGTGTFTYDPAYLENPDAHSLDPINLPLLADEFKTRTEGGFWGAMLDCCPQEWGQRIMAMMGAELEARGDPELARAVAAEGAGDPHYMMLLGSGYGTGSLRFAGMNGLKSDALEPSPTELNSASIDDIRQIAEVHAMACENVPLTAEQRAYLIPGMSLGGARPKAVVKINNELWIAKFHRARESVDIQRVEYAANILAKLAGLTVAPSAIEIVHTQGQERTIFLSKRFDRRDNGTPIHYVSAASVLSAPRAGAPGIAGRVDLEQAQAAYSYSDIADVIRRISSAIGRDSHELFRRMVFNVMIGNRDDHLCNHGFLLDPIGPRYRLSPAFDLALTPNQGMMHPINLGEMGRMPNLTNVMSRYQSFGLKHTEACAILQDVGDAIAEWPRVLASLKVSDADASWVRQCVMTEIPARIRDAAKMRVDSELKRPVLREVMG